MPQAVSLWPPESLVMTKAFDFVAIKVRNGEGGPLVRFKLVTGNVPRVPEFLSSRFSGRWQAWMVPGGRSSSSRLRLMIGCALSA